MMKLFELFLVIFSIACVTRAKTIEELMADLDSPDLLSHAIETPSSTEKIIENYLENTKTVQILRKEMFNELHALNTAIGSVKLDAKEKRLLSELAGKLRNIYDDLDFLLNEFVPNDDDATEIIETFNLINSEQPSGSANPLFKHKRSQTPKRNSLNGLYYKIPVIRTG